MSIAKAAEVLGFLDLIGHSTHLRENDRKAVLQEIMQTTPWTALQGSLPVTTRVLHQTLREAIDH